MRMDEWEETGESALKEVDEPRNETLDEGKEPNSSASEKPTGTGRRKMAEVERSLWV
jgi:hypothetical protein